MGALCARPEVLQANVRLSGEKNIKSIDNIDDLIFDTVYKNSNKITREYSIELVTAGRGAFSEVRKAIHVKTNELRAIKIMYKKNWSKKQQKRILGEIDIQRNLDHPNIIKIYEYFEDDKFIYLVMEYARNGELFNKIQTIKCFNEKEAAEIFSQLLSGVAYLHNNNVVHRDLKPENILLDGDVVKIADFGLSKVLTSEEKMTKSKGTIYYMAPEVLNGAYTEKCDVWSCGVILHILLSGKPPFTGTDDDKILTSILKGKYSLQTPEFDHVSAQGKDLIQKMLTYNQDNRISIKEAVNNKWFDIVEATHDRALDPQIMTNLKTFNVGNKMQQAVYMFLVNHLATREEQKQLYDTFKALDANKSGTISPQELIEGYKRLDININAIDVENLMKRIDLDRSGEINYSEFIIAAIDRKNMLVDKRMRSCFNMIDVDHNGKISLPEFRNVLQGKRAIRENVWKDLIELADLDGDGEIGYSEFKDLLIKMTQL